MGRGPPDENEFGLFFVEKSDDDRDTVEEQGTSNAKMYKYHTISLSPFHTRCRLAPISPAWTLIWLNYMSYQLHSSQNMWENLNRFVVVWKKGKQKQLQIYNVTKDFSRSNINPYHRPKQCYKIQCEDPQAVSKVLHWLLTYHRSGDSRGRGYT